MLLQVQMFEGLDKIHFEPPGSRRVSPNQWEVEDIWFLRAEIADLPAPQGKEMETLYRRFRGAVSKALKETGGWRDLPPEGFFCKDVRDERGNRLHLPEFCAIRFSAELWELRRHDGTTYSMPMSGGPSPGIDIASHFSSVQGKAWKYEDTSDWSSLNHLFSHGH